MYINRLHLNNFMVGPDKSRMENSLRVIAEELSKFPKQDYWKVRKMINCLQIIAEGVEEL